MANSAKLRKVMDRIDSLPDRVEAHQRGLVHYRLSETGLEKVDYISEDVWDQAVWFVTGERDVDITDAGVVEHETLHPCGTAACFAGWTAVLLAPLGSKFHSGMFFTPGEKFAVPIAEWARGELELTSVEANALFGSNNTREDLRRLVDELTGEE